MSERKLIGLLAIIIGAAIIAPRETGLVLDVISTPSKKTNKATKKPIINEMKTEPAEQVGLLRRTKKNIITNANKFWKWLY